MGEIADMLFDQGFDDFMDGRDDHYCETDYRGRYRGPKYHNLKPGASCPECGNMLELKTNSRNHTQFVGCSDYPHCKVTSGYERPEAGGEVHVDKVISVNAYVQPSFNCRDCRFHEVDEIGDIGLTVVEHYCILHNWNIDKGPHEECL